MKTKITLLIIGLFATEICSGSIAFAALTPVSLQCECRVNPQGLDEAQNNKSTVC